MRKLLYSLSILFLSTSLLFAADDSRLRVYPNQGLIPFKGIDERTSPTSLQDGRALEAVNVKFTSTGGMEKRFGYSLVNSTLDIPDVDFQAITGIYYAKLSSGTEYTVAICGDRFYYDNSGTWTQRYGSPAITYATTNQFQFVTALDNIIFTNNTDVILKWSGGTTYSALDVSDLSDTLTKSKTLIWYRNYLILGNTVENSVNKKTRFRWPNVGTIETWSNDDYIDIDVLGGQEIVGFGELFGDLYIFLTDSIYKATLVGGDEIFVISKVIEGTGCIARNSIVNITLSGKQQGIVFLSKDKKINFFDGTNVVEASYLIPTTMSALSASRLQYASGIEDGDDYYLSVTTGAGSTNNLVLDLQLDTGDWSQHTQIDSNYLAKIIDSSSDTHIYSGNYDSFVYKLFVDSTYNDIDGFQGTFDDASTTNTQTASGLCIIYDAANSFTCTGAIVRIISGTGSGEEKVIVSSINSGIVVDSTFSSTPDTTSAYIIGDIPATYTTKWFDLGEPSRRKQFGELYLWADEDSGSTLEIDYAKDFQAYTGTQSISLNAGSAVWGTAIWGTSKWGGQSALLKLVKLNGDGRFIKFKFVEDDIDQVMNIYGFSVISWSGDIQ